MKKLFLLMAAGLMGFAANAQSTLYVCGTGTGLGWDVASPLEVAATTDGHFSFVLENAQSFKMSTAKGDWDSFNSEAKGVATVIVGENVIGPWGENTNLPWAGDWTLDVDWVNNTMTASTTTPNPGNAAIYLRGDMNDWGTPDEWKFETTDGVNYTLSDVTIAKGQSFKIADANWAAYNFGSVTDMVANREYTLLNASYSSNCNMAYGYTGTIELNINTGAVNFTAKTLANLGGMGTYETRQITVDNAVVTYFDADNVGFLQDENGAIYFGWPYAPPTLERGTVINGDVQIMSFMGGVYMILSLDNATVTDGPDPEPYVITDLNEVYDGSLNYRLVKITNEVTPFDNLGYMINLNSDETFWVSNQLGALPMSYDYPANVVAVTGILMGGGGGFCIAPRGESDIEVAAAYNLGNISEIADGAAGLVDLENAVVTFIDPNSGIGFLENENGAIMFASMDDVLPVEGSILSGVATMISYGFAYVFADTTEITITEGPAPQPTVISNPDQLNGYAMNRLVSVSNDVMPMKGQGDVITFTGYDNLFGIDYFGVLPEGYEFPENIENLVGIFTTPIGIGYSDDDMGVSTEGNYFIAPRSLADITIATGIQSIESNNAAVEYFNLQGVRVANPSNGVYIMRQGNKVSKVIISE